MFAGSSGMQRARLGHASSVVPICECQRDRGLHRGGLGLAVK
jgi:hypothetical protein